MFTPNLWDTVPNSQMRKLRFWEVEELVQSHLDNQISTVLFQRPRFTSYSILFIISGRVVPKTVFYQPRSIPSQHSSFWEASFPSWVTWVGCRAHDRYSQLSSPQPLLLCFILKILTKRISASKTHVSPLPLEGESTLPSILYLQLSSLNPLLRRKNEQIVLL